jgi:uncharacterized protein YdaU (DUF1376 family)
MASSWYPFFPGDYARDTAHLTLAEHGAYRLLLDHYYSTGRPIPADLERAFRICRAFTPELQGSVGSVLEQFFTETPEGWRNQRADRQIEKQQRVSAKYAARAKNAATARWEHASSIPQAMLEASEPEPEPEPKIPPPSKESVLFLKENARAREAPETPNPRQKDFDERNLRRLHEARKETEMKLNNGWGRDLTPDEIFVYQCELAGLTVENALGAIKRGKQWPETQALGASA